MLKILILGLVFIFSGAYAQASNCFPFGKKGVSASEFKVSNFSEVYQSCGYKRKDLFTLRSFKLNGDSMNLVVNPESLDSFVIKSSCLKSCINLTDREVSRTKYGELLDRGDDGHYRLQNDGVTTGSSNRYVALTIDMCPSSKGISQNVYTELVNLSQRKRKPIPISIAMTAGWQKRHSERFNWIKSQVLAGRLKVQWVNHSYHHTYLRGVRLALNFMLSSGTDVRGEVLGNEISMLEGGVTPSVFFRFPGLVSSKHLIRGISEMGLVPLGSDAWLAKGEHAEEGDIILIHGNRNEPAGEEAFFRYLNTMDDKGHEFGSLFDVFYN